MSDNVVQSFVIPTIGMKVTVELKDQTVFRPSTQNPEISFIFALIDIILTYIGN